MLGSDITGVELTGSDEENKDCSLLYMTPCVFVNMYRRFGGTYCFHPRTKVLP